MNSHRLHLDYAMIISHRCWHIVLDTRCVHSNQDDFVLQSAAWYFPGQCLADAESGKFVWALEIHQELAATVAATTVTAGGCANVRPVIRFQGAQTGFAKLHCVRIFRNKGWLNATL